MAPAPIFMAYVLALSFHIIDACARVMINQSCRQAGSYDCCGTGPYLPKATRFESSRVEQSVENRAAVE